MRLTCVSLAIAAFASAACRYHGNSSADGGGVARDTSAFAAIAMALAAEHGVPPTVFRIDPRPFVETRLLFGSRDDISWERGVNRLMPTDSARELSARRAILRKLRIPEDDGMLPEECAGTTMPDFGRDYHAGCPKSSHRFASISIPRRGDFTDPARTVDSTRWTVSVTVTNVGPSGINQTMFHYVLASEMSRWVVLKSEGFGVIE